MDTPVFTPEQEQRVKELIAEAIDAAFAEKVGKAQSFRAELRLKRGESMNPEQVRRQIESTVAQTLANIIEQA